MVAKISGFRSPPLLPQCYIAGQFASEDGHRGTPNPAINPLRAQNFGLPESCQAPESKIFRFTVILICGKKQPARAAMRGASRSSRNVARVAMDACGVRCFGIRRKRRSVRRNRVVLAPRPWRYAVFPPAMGARKAASPGRARINRLGTVLSRGEACYLRY